MAVATKLGSGSRTRVARLRRHLRVRKKVQGKIKALTAQGMAQGVIVCLMPVFMMLLFSFIDPTYMRPFFTTPIGWMMMALVFALDGVGLWLMLRLVKVEV